ncbi:hypothetical protein GA0115240_15265 [Streptomyces sp. DvalAA-14]|uniref:hypothetical protein n=1 Tax=unclassified Streptomyces TaxID=2593676 RepID=UPI00081BC191|nr:MULTISPECIES: hypothetical protein [unclassified Streptomyces]MYS23459.1 hypothetical protein [Streptomyces sp. SID4948]SCE33636.1 hypothetical protein GA0115240_15265 [Streptomyces sp. DvalAA-14]
MDWKSRLTVRQAEGDRFVWKRRPTPVLDLSYGDLRLAAVREAAGRGTAEQWPVIRAHLAAARDGEDLTFLVEGLRTAWGVERWIGEVIAAEPGDPLPRLVSAARHIGWAWHARGESDAVPDRQRKLFRARLETAEEQLFAVVEREPSWAAPWYFLQISGRGLEVGPQEADRRFEAACRRAPGHLAAHREHLQQLSRKWGGSHERMHAFAREAMLAAPGGSALGELVAMAHLEEWLSLGGDPESLQLSSPQVVGALHEAADRSVRHPAFVRQRDWTITFNVFAMAFALAGDHRAAQPLFRVLGKRVTETPWKYLDGRSPLVPYLRWRSRVAR